MANNCCSTDDDHDWRGDLAKTICTAENASPAYVDSNNDDFDLASGDLICKHNGTDLSPEGDFLFDADIRNGTMPGGKAGQSRSGSWDTGFDEYVTAARGVGQLHWSWRIRR